MMRIILLMVSLNILVYAAAPHLSAALVDSTARTADSASMQLKDALHLEDVRRQVRQIID